MVSSDGTCTGQECAPASGAQGTVRMKVGKGTKRASTGTGGSAVEKVEGGPPSFKLQLLDRKLKHDKMRQDAAFAAELLKNPNLSITLASHAEDILLSFLTKLKEGPNTEVASVSSNADDVSL